MKHHHHTKAWPRHGTGEARQVLTCLLDLRLSHAHDSKRRIKPTSEHKGSFKLIPLAESQNRYLQRWFAHQQAAGLSRQEPMMLQTEGWRGSARCAQGGGGRAAKIQVLLSPPLSRRGLQKNQPAEVCTDKGGTSTSSLPGTRGASRGSQLQSRLCTVFQEACVSRPSSARL